MKRILLIFLVFCFAGKLFAQDEEKKKGFQKEKLFVGGNFGLSIGDYTLINLSPQIGYRFNRFIAAGIGTNFQYISLKERDLQNNSPYRKVTQGVLGLNLFGRFYPIEHLMLQVQPEGNYIFGKQKFYATSTMPEQTFKLDAIIVPSFLAGGGLVIPSGRGAMILSLMYDVLQQQNSPYGKQPIVNFTYNIGL